METSSSPPEGLIASLSASIGSTEAALRLLITLLAGYPLALIHRNFIHGKPANLQHLYFIISGLSFGFFNYGLESLHSAFTVVFSYLTLVIFRGTATCVAISFVFNMAYLLIGYVYSSTNDYDINWTLPQCVLVLRLIGLSFDLYDGNQPEESLGAQNKRVALKTRPTFLEYGGHMFFPTCYMIGPQFNMRRYQSFVAGEFSEGDKSKPPNSIAAGTRRLFLGIGYVALFHVVNIYVNDDYLLSDDYASAPFWKRALLLGVWGRIVLYKYISCWLLTEGACIMFGLTYNGKDAQGNAKWDGVSNVDLAKFENSTEFNHYIQSFNTNTNNWVAQYIYKRMKFMNNRYVSQLSVLLFLAVWHGFHTGYYVSFFFEFIIMFMERDIHSIFAKNPHLGKYFEPLPVRVLLYILMRLYTLVFMGWCLAPFSLFSFDRYWPVFRAVHYMGIWFFVPWGFLYGPLLRMAVKATRPKVVEHAHTE
ncbi:lysophospholipid acyltransferase 5 [Atheta coriaria]|uniref:lysophospholipid acyltransferase 5 n=1 Tax=Dalotia coriaria TaxID=877792 RepID=UPI0031F43403